MTASASTSSAVRMSSRKISLTHFHDWRREPEFPSNFRILRGEGAAGVRDGLDEGVQCSCRGFAPRGLAFRERLCDGSAVWARGWQRAHRRAGLRDCFLDAFAFGAGEIVQDDAV